MKTTRRNFLGAVAAFVLGVQAEVFRRVADVPTPPRDKDQFITVDVRAGNHGTYYSWLVDGKKSGVYIAHEASYSDEILSVTRMVFAQHGERPLCFIAEVSDSELA